MNQIDEPEMIAPPFVQACRAMDHLWMASNALSHCNNRKARQLQEQVNIIRRDFTESVLPSILRKETLG